MAPDFLPKWLRTILKVGVVISHLSRLPADGLTGGTLKRHLELHQCLAPKPSSTPQQHQHPAGSVHMQSFRVVN